MNTESLSLLLRSGKFRSATSHDLKWQASVDRAIQTAKQIGKADVTDGITIFYDYISQEWEVHFT